MIKPNKININNENDKDNDLINQVKENENNTTKDTPKNDPTKVMPMNNPTKDMPKNKQTPKPSEKGFKSKAPTNLLLPPDQVYTKPGDNSSPKSPKSPKSTRIPRSPKSPRSPSLMSQFQAVRTGLQIVSQMKPE